MAGVEHAVRPGQVINTLGIARPNRIVSIDRAGVLVETERSAEKGTGPQLVPAWMIATAWQHLRVHGRKLLAQHVGVVVDARLLGVDAGLQTLSLRREGGAARRDQPRVGVREQVCGR